MNQTCGDCGQEYDDVYHMTTCPHEYFKDRKENLADIISQIVALGFDEDHVRTSLAELGAWAPEEVEEILASLRKADEEARSVSS